tara:strand:+ start:3626 stop:4468 length:843 start_codon:yes stop_codon:yes gene_type:complete
MKIPELIKLALPNSIKKIGLSTRYSWRSYKHPGSKYCCSICKQKFDRFISLSSICNGKFLVDVDVNNVIYSVNDYETLSIENFMCPVCGAQDKARMYALYLSKKLEEYIPGQKVKLLHFAPEAGLENLLKYDARVDYRSADLLRDNVDDRVDLTDMRIYADCSFDAVICSHILEHIPSDKAAVRELYRVLKRGGWGIVMVPILTTLTHTFEDFTKTTEAERIKHFGQEDHVRIYAKNDFISLLETARFLVRQLGLNYFGKDKFENNGLSEKSVLYLVQKQ